jgi:uncharacterized protein
MKINGQAKSLRIFLGESDKIKQMPLYEAIVIEARKAGLAGATVLRGMLGFGPTSHIRTAKILDLSSDLPIVVEIVDEEGKIDDFLPVLSGLIEKSCSGGLVTIEKIGIIRYSHGNHYDK